MNELESSRLFPSSQRRGGRAINKNGSVPKRRGRGGQFASNISECVCSTCWRERPPRLRRFRWLRNFQLMPQPPLLCEEGNTPHSTFLQFIHTFADRPGCIFCAKPIPG